VTGLVTVDLYQGSRSPLWHSDGVTARLLVALPAWNEAETIAGVIAGVRDVVPEADILVLDDASSDTTSGVAEAAGATVVKLTRHGGVGSAMRRAFQYAIEQGYDYVIQVDADGQHDPTSIPVILGALQTHAVVVGSRFRDERNYRLRGPRRWAMWLLSKGMSQLTHAPLSDTTSGYRGADRSAIELFAQQYPSEYLGDTVGSLVIASRAGLSIAEVPVVMRERQGGSPSHSPVQAAYSLTRTAAGIFAALAHLRQRGPSTPEA
jgi:glycosyltransferase involved in cell wall biosynthesis